ncbi:MAG TPA: DNA starvation/stationary phase protection protein Dps [Thermomicrobiales bacterium]|jgi:starvation-inducible DNA-binding protein|nr:DNA starvation/stationary phase protection protein Dps [Thermomicrobiales bacterium]
MAATATTSKTRSAERTFPTSNDLPKKTRDEVIALLNQQLADSLDLYSQTKQAHWNVKGMNFYQLHLLFDEHAAHVIPWIDMLAERAVMLGGYATGTVRMSAEHTTLAEFPTKITSGKDYVEALVARWAAYAASTRAAIDTSDEAGDADTADLFTEISRQVDMDLWFLEAHLQD